MQGAGDISEIDYALLEQNGSISVFKKSDTPLSHPIIIDGEVDKEELKLLKKSDEWLESELKKNRVRRDDIFLLTFSPPDNIYIIRKKKKK